jgi:small subunit ribosomal protein S21
MNHFRAREKKPEPETTEVQPVVEAPRPVDIVVAHEGGGNYAVSGSTDAGRAFVKEYSMGGPEDVWGPRPAKSYFGCTGIGPFLKAAEQAGLVVRRSVTNLIVEVFDNDVEGALRQFKKEMAKSGTAKDIKRQSYHLKPSQARRLKSKIARAKARKATKRRVLHADAA